MNDKRLKDQAVARAKVEARDLELIKQIGPELNEEVADILRYQDRALKRVLALK
jgi:regulator of sigma D